MSGLYLVYLYLIPEYLIFKYLSTIIDDGCKNSLMRSPLKGARGLDGYICGRGSPEASLFASCYDRPRPSSLALALVARWRSWLALACGSLSLAGWSCCARPSSLALVARWRSWLASARGSLALVARSRSRDGLAALAPPHWRSWLAPLHPTSPLLAPPHPCNPSSLTAVFEYNCLWQFSGSAASILRISIFAYANFLARL